MHLIQHVGGFNPGRVLGCKLGFWLGRGNYTLDDDDKLASIQDIYGVSGGAVQTDPTKRPGCIVQANGCPAAVFSGGQSLKVSALTLSSSFTAFIAFSATANGLIYEHSEDANANPGMYLYTGTNYTMFLHRSLASDKNYYHTPDWGLGDELRLARVQSNGTHSGHRLFVNSLEVELANGSDTADVGTSDTTQNLYIGSRASSYVFITGKLYLLFIYCPVLSVSQAQYLEQGFSGWMGL